MVMRKYLAGNLTVMGVSSPTFISIELNQVSNVFEKTAANANTQASTAWENVVAYFLGWGALICLFVFEQLFPLKV